MKTTLSASFNACWRMADAVARAKRSPEESVILFSIDDDGQAKLTSRCADDQAFLVVRLPDGAVEVSEPGTALLPTVRTSAFFDKLFSSAVPVNLTVNNDTLKASIRAGGSRFGFSVVDPAMKPVLPADSDSELVFKAPLEQFCDCAKFGAIASDPKAAFPKYVSFELFDIMEDNSVSVVSTDGKRLSLAGFTRTQGSGSERLLIPVDNINLCLRLCSLAAPLFKKDDSPKEIEVWKNDRALVFKTEFFEYISTYSTVQFPAFEKLLDFEPVTSIKIDRKELISCIDRGNILLSAGTDAGGARNLRVEVEPAKNTVNISAKNFNVGESLESLDCDATGMNLVVGFQAAYLLDGLQSIPDKTVELKFSGNEGPCIICPAGESVGAAADGEEEEKKRGSGFIYLVMPVKLSHVA